MYEGLKQRLYGLFERKGVRIEANRTVDSPNFCCLKIRYQPVRGMTLIIGTFTDDVLEVLLIAHEFGHIIHYENLSQEDAEAAYCAIFASNHRGLENISPESKKLVIDIEKKASEHALALLKTITSDETIISRATQAYANWIEGYLKKAKLSTIDALAS